MNIYVGNLDRKTAENELQVLFEQFGEVRSVKIIKDNVSGESKGFAFIEMMDKDSAIRAIESLNAKEFGYRRLKVNEAKPRNTENKVFNSFSSNYGYRDRNNKY